MGTAPFQPSNFSEDKSSLPPMIGGLGAERSKRYWSVDTLIYFGRRQLLTTTYDQIVTIIATMRKSTRLYSDPQGFMSPSSPVHVHATYNERIIGGTVSKDGIA
ncbi:hypothetical protein AFLA_010864 [Aspergillus flavus NRRL3357]|nr:hypothetical protein AFLA_010864 [Aspergillus flavus NRRL3357]